MSARVAAAGGVPLRIWVVAARPRTLPAAISPVLVATYVSFGVAVLVGCYLTAVVGP